MAQALLNGFAAYQSLCVALLLFGVRILCAFMLLPATSDIVLPGIARNGVVYLLTYFVAAGQPLEPFEHLSGALLLVLAGKEAFLGVALGYVASTVFWVAQSVGMLIDGLTGFNSVQMSNPLRGDSSTPVATILLQLSVALFYLGGGMLFLLSALFQSFRWWPPYALWPSLSQMAETFLLQRGDSMWMMIARLATPFMLVLLLVDLGFGVIAHAADRLAPNSLSQPLRGVLGLMMLIVLVSVFTSQVLGDVALGGFARDFAQGMVGSTSTSTSTSTSAGAAAAPAVAPAATQVMGH
ncbi:type III secretion system export apparatus subunit SctT [Paraburkholderia hayleyella]|uniref:type III secretion system export apparatus subunit SctT n=1 Tax=Paraburkholderia hayleyella TaxID=2152889 RepID=UPI001FE76758|nr:type III secretion system export apparatus subunit SctT [Paraburkholderia hayleyella]